MGIDRPLLYTLDEHRNPVPCDDTLAWAQWSHSYNRCVAVTCIKDDIVVSTVFLGIDASPYMDGDPLLFETMVFVGPVSLDKHTSRTWAEAEQVHESVVKNVRDYLPNAGEHHE